MIEGLATALSTNGIYWIITASIIAGIVRGFAGFGAGMIFIPVVGVFTDPITTVVALQTMDGIGALPLLRRGIKEGEPRQVAFLTLCAVLFMPLGIYFLATTESDVFRWIVAGLIVVLLGLMMSGWRYTKRLGATGTFGVGGVSGFMSGFFGLGGPPVIMMYMSGPYRAQMIRANIIIYFFLLTAVAFLLLAMRDLLTAERLWLGLILVIPYALATLVGQKIFDPTRETLFRTVAYGVIMASVLLSLPLWS